jgi:hypothetical protein
MSAWNSAEAKMKRGTTSYLTARREEWRRIY